MIFKYNKKVDLVDFFITSYFSQLFLIHINHLISVLFSPVEQELKTKSLNK